MIPVAAGEEAGPKLLRLLCFVGAAVLCTAGINKWKDLENKSKMKTATPVHNDNNPSLDKTSLSKTL